MAEIDLANPSPVEGDVNRIDIKEALVRVQPISSNLTPAATPEEKSPSDEDTMAGKKIFQLERPDDRARELAARLTLEEQVGCLSPCLPRLDPSNACRMRLLLRLQRYSQALGQSRLLIAWLWTKSQITFSDAPGERLEMPKASIILFSIAAFFKSILFPHSPRVTTHSVSWISPSYEMRAEYRS